MNIFHDLVAAWDYTMAHWLYGVVLALAAIVFTVVTKVRACRRSHHADQR